MINFFNREIWLVNYDPSFGHEFRKVRPAIIIENDSLIDSFDLLSIVPISSQKNLYDLDLLLRKDNFNNLISDSIIKTKQINTFDKRRFIKKIGICDIKTFELLKLNLKYFLDI